MKYQQWQIVTREDNNEYVEYVYRLRLYNLGWLIKRQRDYFYNRGTDQTEIMFIPDPEGVWSLECK